MPQDVPEPAIDVEDRPGESRYVAYVDGEPAGFSEYEIDSDRGRIVFRHTVVDDAFEGRGVGGALVRGALDDVRRRRLRVVPQCPFVKAWLDDTRTTRTCSEPLLECAA